MPRILELFKGTGSVGKVFEAHGWEVVSVDIEGKFRPTIVADVLDLPPTIGKGFDFIWFSPPCKNFSRALTRGPRDLEGATKIVKHCLQIIEESKPTYWVLENPFSGLLPKQEFMENFNFTVASYCHYGFPYRKNSIFYNNFNLQLKRCWNDCQHVHKINGRYRHFAHAQKGPSKWDSSNFTTEQLYRIPEPLLESIYCQIFPK